MPIIMMAAIATGFGRSFIAPKIRTANLLPVGKHVVQIISCEFEAPKENAQYTREQDERQLKVVMKNADGIISAWLNDRGFAKMEELTSADIPTDVNFKMLGTTATEWKRMTEAEKINKLFVKTSEGHAVRRDTNTRIVSEKHTLEAQEITGGCLGAAGLTEEDNFTEDELPTLLVGRVVKVDVVANSYNGNDRLKVKAFIAPTEAEVESLTV